MLNLQEHSATASAWATAGVESRSVVDHAVKEQELLVYEDVSRLDVAATAAQPLLCHWTKVLVMAGMTGRQLAGDGLDGSSDLPQPPALISTPCQQRGIGE